MDTTADTADYSSAEVLNYIQTEFKRFYPGAVELTASFEWGLRRLHVVVDNGDDTTDSWTCHLIESEHWYSFRNDEADSECFSPVYDIITIPRRE